jgi:ABC-2 type transport system ATP-binding protein
VSAAQNQSAIEVNDLSFGYAHLKVLEELTLRIPKGVSFGLLGPNGAGKTTLIKILVGLLKPQSGEIRISGEAPSHKTTYQIGYMPQTHALYSELSITENVDFFAHIYGANDRTERSKHVEETIKLVELWERRKDPVANLSGGMKQRVSLACAIVNNPPILFLDEPTVGLDPELRANFWSHFNSLTKQGHTLVLSSHTMDDAAHCDYLAFIRDGKVIARGTPLELKKATGNQSANLEYAFLYFIHHEAANVK